MVSPHERKPDIEICFGAMSAKIAARAVTFDMTRTLVHCPRGPEIYTEILVRHGVSADLEEVRRLLPLVWDEMSCLTRLGEDRFRTHPQGARGWWSRFLERLCEHLETPPPSRFAASELFHRFADSRSWELYDDVIPTLEDLSGRGFRLAVVSNWDERLIPLLESLGLSPYFQTVVFSAGAGVEKPDPRIFLRALHLLEVSPEEALHVGDRRREDQEGALAAGMSALLVDREGGADLDDLRELSLRLAHPLSN
jgi:putative hydrolase of the HAD superfamily